MSLQTEVRVSILKAHDYAVEMCASNQELFDPRQALQLRGDGSYPAEIRQRFWRSNILCETLPTRLADADRTRLAGYTYDSEGVNHDVLVVDVRNSRREIERDKRRIYAERAKRILSDRNGVETTRIMIDAAAGPAYQVAGVFDDLIVKMSVQDFHIWGRRRPFFFSSQQFRERSIQPF